MMTITGLRGIRPLLFATGFVATSSIAAATGAAVQDAVAGSVPPAGQSAPIEVVRREADGRVTVRAVRTRTPLIIDGKLDERVYTDVPAITGFIQSEPVSGVSVTEETEVWILFDHLNLYVSGRCWDRHPERMLRNDMRRDAPQAPGELMGLGLDTFHDRRTGYGFFFGIDGGIWDALVTAEGGSNVDWNGVLDYRASRFERGWQYELKIPFKTLRYPAKPEQEWGINLSRGIKWKSETAYLTKMPVSYGTVGVMRMSAAATLVGLEAPPAGMNLDVKPYALGLTATDRTGQARVKPRDLQAGVDVKYGVTKGLSADFTYNTDFSQVEVDEQQVNLTRFNLLFPEKRDFFLENAGIFNFGGVATAGAGGSGSSADVPRVFFSRQIGLQDGNSVPILAGGRLAGRAGKFSVGTLTVQTRDEDRTPATNFSVLRLKRDVLRRSAIGVLFAQRSRSLMADGANRTYGVDGQFAFFDNLLFTSYMAQTETPSRRDDARSYRGGMNYSGDRYGLELDRLHVGANFRPEIGFLRRTDFDRTLANVRFSPRPTSRLVRKYFFEGLYSDHTNATTGRRESRDVQLTFRTMFHNIDQFNVTLARSYEFFRVPFSIANGVTVPIGGYTFTQLMVNHSLAPHHRFSGTVGYTVGQLYGGKQHTVSYTRGRIQIAPKVYAEPQVSVNRVALPAGVFTATLAGSRLTYTVTPRMFLAALSQYNSATHSVNSNVRFRWEYISGSELFVVYSDGYDTDRSAALLNRSFAIKMNRLFRW